MKVSLDLKQLLEEGKIDRQEYDKFALLGRSNAKSHLWNIVLVLSVLAVVAGFVGMNFEFFRDITLKLVDLFGARTLHLMLVVALFAGAFPARSGFLIAASAIAFLSFLGGSSFYTHASYYVAITQPFLTVLVFSALSFAGLAATRYLTLSSAHERLATIFARTCLFIVNMGFWVGSLWGSEWSRYQHISRDTFSIAWGGALIAVGAWGAREGRRFVVNIAAVFASIHFYTQWFEKLGASPGTVMFAGLTALVILYGLRRYNRWLAKQPQ